MNIEIEQKEKKPDIGVSFTRQGDGEYAISFAIENRHVSTNSWNYSHRPAYHAGVDILDMKLNDIYNLALAIMQIAERISGEETK